MTATASTEARPRRRARALWLAAAVAIVCAGVALRAAALRAPVVGDDFILYAMLEGDYPAHRSPLDLFRFARETPADRGPLMDRGLLPWWTAENFRLAMFRPLSSALLCADFALFRHGARGPHAHSLAWLAALLAAAAALYRRALPTPRLALLALALLACDESMTVPVVWLANRNALVAVAFGALAVAAHARAREPGGRPRDAALAALFAALALAGGEYALTVLVYIPLYELFVPPRGAPWRRRLRALAPLAAVVAAYASLSSALGYGARGSSAYIDPLRAPAAFARAAADRLPALVAHLLAGRPIEGPVPDWMRFGSPARVALPALALAALALAGALGRVPDAPARRRVCWLAAGALAGLLPVCAAAPSERLLAGPALGAAGALALLVGEAWEILRPTGAPRGWAFWLRAPVCLAAAVMHVPFAALHSVVATGALAGTLGSGVRALADSTVDPRGMERAVVVLLAAADPQTLHYPPYIWHWDGRAPLPRAWRVLSMGPGPHAIRRVAPDTLEVLTAAPMFANAAALMLRPRDEVMPAGTVVRLDGMTVTTLDETPLGPRHALFRFDRALDDPTVRFYIATPYSLLPLPVPPVGGGGVLPAPSVPSRAGAP